MMAKGLLIETSTDCALLCLAQEKLLVNFQCIEPAQNLSKNLLPAIQELLSRNRMTLKELSYVAVGIGPGAYTGVRVGAVVGKGLSYSLKIPLVSFESPLAFLPDQSGSFIYIADAKMGQSYLLKGSKVEEKVILHFPAELIDTERLDEASFRADFLVTPANRALNPSLLASIAFERFSSLSPQEFKLLYYR